MRIIVSILLFAACPLVWAQTAETLPGCETRAEVQRALDDKLSDKVLENMKITEQRTATYQVVQELIAKYPRELAPYRKLINFTRYNDPERYPALVDGFVKGAEDHPGDPLALYLAATVLNGKDTPRAVELLNQAHTKAPQFAWPELALANIHAGGKLVDKKKAAEEVSAFFAICPSSTDGSAQWMLTRAGGAELQAKVAVALRARLAHETDPKKLEEYATLWGLEFRTHPPQEHDAVRKQVAADLKRLESMNPKPDAEWAAFLKDGYKQSGVAKEIVTAKEDHIIEMYPHSYEAFAIVSDRWKKDNKEPEDQKDAEAWKKYDAVHVAAVRSSIGRFTEYRYLQHMNLFYVIANDYDIPEAEAIPVMDDYLTETTVYQQASAWNYLSAADFLADHRWQPERVLELARQGEKQLAIERGFDKSDNRSAEEAKDQDRSWIYLEQGLADAALRAALQLGKPDAVDWLKASVEAAPPTDTKVESGYWANRARLAALEGHKADALAFYQKSLFTRLEPRQPYHGRLKDNETEEARALWKESGGTAEAWTLWITPPGGKTAELAEGRWEKPTKPLPAFELADLSGKTWKLKQLEGKSVLINVWATWCGPCNAELPKLEKLYQQVKNRTDFQILTFDIDSELGLVEPFMKEKGFTFPVLPAFSLVTSLLDSVAIPQNWIVDPKGMWRWSQLGYDASDANWGETMIGKLEGVKTQ